jgi:hypothetical protein
MMLLWSWSSSLLGIVLMCEIGDDHLTESFVVHANKHKDSLLIQ